MDGSTCLTRGVDWRNNRIELREIFGDNAEAFPTWSVLDFPSKPAWFYSIDLQGDGTAELLNASAVFDSAGDYTVEVFLLDTPLEEDVHYDSDDWTDLTNNNGFGTSFWTIPDPKLQGDLNRDGYEDVIMRGYTPDTDYAELWVYHQDGTWDPSSPDLRIELPMTLGDINGDNELDLALSLPDPERESANRVLLLLGPFDSGVVNVDEDPDGWLIGQDTAYEYGSEQHYGSRLGEGLVFLPDINGDGCDELLIGEPGYESNPPEDHGPGAVNLIFGAPGMP